MPVQLPSSFASAAAGQNRDSRVAGRGDSVRGSASGEWPRSNGTRTFRRPSTTPFNQTASASADAPQNPAHDAPLASAPVQTPVYETPGSLRYTKEELLEIYAMRQSMVADASSLFMPSWNPNHVNGTSSRGWGKSGDSQHVPQDPTVCWDPNGNVRPISLEEMSPEEREFFATDVNSTLKPPQQGKDNQGGAGQNGRKTSISQTNAGNLSSPSTASRPGTRRRETADTNPFPSAGVASPTGSRFSRDEPWLPRRSTDLKETITDEPEEDLGSRDPPLRTQPFGMPRSNTAGSSAFGGAALWGTSTASPSSGLGGFGNFALNTSAIGDKRFGTGSSRLAHLIPKDSSENLAGKAIDHGNADLNRGWRPRQRTDTDPFGGDGGVSGSAILGGAQDNSPPSLASQLQRGNTFDTPVKGGTADFGMSGLNLGGHGEGNGPASPSETNPYRSPLADRADDGQDDNDVERQGLGGTGSEPPSHYGTLSRNFTNNPFDGSDRSQTSSVGAKGFATVNPLTGWPAAGTPDRERQPFNTAFGGIFGPVDGLPSPGLQGSLSMFGAPGGSGLGRGGGRLGSLFPAAMQAQMHGQDQENLSDSVPDLRQTNPLGAIGRGPISAPARETGSPVRGNRSAFEDMFLPNDAARSAFSGAEQGQAGLTTTTPGQTLASSSTAASFPSATDPVVRTMVMPDRMRWVYLDPQGTIQGPFSGLEMNDWYKANFFSPDLRVRRLEDPEFEPLGQLIRRIGNSREPFLVPQMGVPHGPAQQPFTVAGSEAIPPLQNAFPSFGRTLTAAQQNDLERRKQEEQLYHARQRELAHHHQPFGRLPMQPGVPGALHHHSSAHSLQSQPSYGSISSPIGAPQQAPIGAIGPNAPFFETPTNISMPQAAADIFNPDLNLSERQLLANMQAAGGIGAGFPSQPIAGEPSGLRSQLPPIDQLQKDSQGFSTRIKEFHELRAQHEAEEAAIDAIGSAQTDEEASEHDVSMSVEDESDRAAQEQPEVRAEPAPAKSNLSLTERVKKTQADAAAAAAAAAVVAAAAVAKPSQQPSSSGLPMPFPPPAQSSTPIAAPTAQRPASNLPTRYDERSASGTPDTTSDGAALAPPPTAPWASTETHRGPSLKEIQEAEAKKAAKKEEAAAALRRAALEQEAAALREREKAAAAAVVGLPPTSTWGTGSPVGAPPGGSAWKQPTATKGGAASGSSGSAGSKKTLAEIQREEEHRKQKAREAAAMQNTAASGAGMGKRYADLASKSSAPPGLGAGSASQSSSGGGWSTVGAGGKVKIPTGPAAQTRSVSASAVKTSSTPVSSRPAVKAPVGLKDAKGVAMEEFKKWLHRELARGLIGVTDIEQFAATLLEMPLDPLILSEAVYGYSTTMDGRHFADEFVRRKKLADRGMFDKEPASSGPETKNSSNGGWNEVAKKGGSSSAPKEDANNIAGFRMVPKKGKGKKQG